nr:hypothetical protein [uncultured bacterium]
MNEIEQRPLYRGWPLYEPPRQFELGSILSSSPDDVADFAVRQALGHKRSGWWECDLSNSSLTWTSGVYEIFGLPIGASVTRREALSVYEDESRAAMERLRSHAIRHNLGFVIDSLLKPADGTPDRWMRLIGAPVCEDGRAVRIHGLKLWL